MTAPVAEQAAPAQPFRRRLLDGLAASIEERGYRETTVADIVRHARTSKRTFYDHFPTKDAAETQLRHLPAPFLANNNRPKSFRMSEIPRVQ